MVTRTILLEIDVEEGEDAAVKELLAYLAYTKRIKKYLWREKDPSSSKLPNHSAIKDELADKTPADKSADKHQAGKHTGQAPAQETHSHAKHTREKPTVPSQVMTSMQDSLAEWKKDNKLIRLKALKGKGKFLDIACKIVSHDADSGTVTVYDVDRKVVETVRLTEIEDIGLAL